MNLLSVYTLAMNATDEKKNQSFWWNAENIFLKSPQVEKIAVLNLMSGLVRTGKHGVGKYNINLELSKKKTKKNHGVGK